MFARHGALSGTVAALNLEGVALIGRRLGIGILLARIR